MNNFGGPPMTSTSQNITRSGRIVVRLNPPEIWNKLNAVGNEMQVETIGRSLRPRLEYVVEGLDPNKIYSMHVHFERMNRSLLMYEDGVWNEEFDELKDVPAKTNAFFVGTETGADWLLYGIDASRLKIFKPRRRGPNVSREVREQDAARILRNEQTMINVRTLCRYVPVLEIYELAGAHNFLCHTAKFDETKFVVVTNYKNKDLIKMKTDEILKRTATTNPVSSEPDIKKERASEARGSSNQGQENEYYPYN
ncbi:unnamed protein product [Caenorhabditis sp. 36 PRJEB53466]|nr:unnamed protein product [Caenorhabditis sp. 36 PRJEB53466]